MRARPTRVVVVVGGGGGCLMKLWIFFGLIKNLIYLFLFFFFFWGGGGGGSFLYILGLLLKAKVQNWTSFRGLLTFNSFFCFIIGNRPFDVIQHTYSKHQAPMDQHTYLEKSPI